MLSFGFACSLVVIVIIFIARKAHSEGLLVSLTRLCFVNVIIVIVIVIPRKGLRSPFRRLAH